MVLRGVSESQSVDIPSPCPQTEIVDGAVDVLWVVDDRVCCRVDVDVDDARVALLKLLVGKHVANQHALDPGLVVLDRRVPRLDVFKVRLGNLGEGEQEGRGKKNAVSATFGRGRAGQAEPLLEPTMARWGSGLWLKAQAMAKLRPLWPAPQGTRAAASAAAGTSLITSFTTSLTIGGGHAAGWRMKQENRQWQ